MAGLSSEANPDVLCTNLQVEQPHVERSHCSMESLITLDSSDDLTVEGGSDYSGEMVAQQEVEGGPELAKEMNGEATRFVSEGDDVKAVSSIDQPYDTSKPASSPEADVPQQEISSKKREGRRVKTDKKRITREKKINVSIDDANFIAKVEVTNWGG